MATYRVAGKHIFRTTTLDLQMGTRADGSPNIVRQPGVMQRIEVGTVLEDVTPEELAAAPDRFEQIDDATAQALQEAGIGLAMNAPLRGCHEPVNALDAPVQKPPLTAPEVAGALAARVEVTKVDQQQAEQQQKMQREREEVQAKAMTETVEAEVKKAQQQAQQARSSRGATVPPQGALPVSTSGESSPATPPPPPVSPPPASTPPAASPPEDPASTRPRR